MKGGSKEIIIYRCDTGTLWQMIEYREQTANLETVSSNRIGLKKWVPTKFPHFFWAHCAMKLGGIWIVTVRKDS